MYVDWLSLLLCCGPAVDTLPHQAPFSRHHPPQQVASTILPCVQQLVNDTSEHVKAALASVINDLAPLLGPEATKFQLIPMLQPLLKDQHADVRLNVIAKLEAINEVGGSCHVDVHHLRMHGGRGEAFSSFVPHYLTHAPIVINVSGGGRRHPARHAPPRHHDAGGRREVARAHGHHRAHPRARAAARPRCVSQTAYHCRCWLIPPHLTAPSSLIPSLRTPNHPGFFNEALAELCTNWLEDDVHSIRLAATENLRRLADLFGAEWTQAHVFPKIEELHAFPTHQEVGGCVGRRRGKGGASWIGPIDTNGWTSLSFTQTDQPHTYTSIHTPSCTHSA